MIFHDFAFTKIFFPIKFSLDVLQRVFDRLLLQIFPFFVPSRRRTVKKNCRQKNSRHSRGPLESVVELVHISRQVGCYKKLRKKDFFRCKMLYWQLSLLSCFTNLPNGNWYILRTVFYRLISGLAGLLADVSGSGFIPTQKRGFLLLLTSISGAFFSYYAPAFLF